MSSNNNDGGTVSSGIGVGNVIAAIISFAKWHSIGWCILHGFLGWIYIIYYLFVYWN